MSIADDLRELLPAELPNREACIRGAARHYELIVEANERFNLTRIVSPREAAIKHVLDSVLPWKLFPRSGVVADAGAGAGFPGIPLAMVLPETRWVLIEATRKKADFLAAAVAELGLANVEVVPERAETILKANEVDVITARAMAPISRAIGYFAPALMRGTQVLMYKGPDALGEIIEAQKEARNRRWNMRIAMEYELPEGMGSRTVVEMKR